jgi:hypothetical protein
MRGFLSAIHKAVFKILNTMIWRNISASVAFIGPLRTLLEMQWAPCDCTHLLLIKEGGGCEVAVTPP